MLQPVQQGAHVAVCDIDGNRLETAARRARAANPAVRVSAHVVDVADGPEVARLADAVAQAHACDAIHLLFDVRTGMPSPPRSWRRAFGSFLADHQPVPSATAAAAILEAGREGRWRVVIGHDPQAVDERVRADPWTAYD